MASSWGETFGGLLSGLGDAASAVSETVQKGVGAYSEAKNAIQGRSADVTPIWSTNLTDRQNLLQFNRGTVGTDAYLQPVATLTGEFSTTEIVLLFVAALAAGWAFTRF